ncbi:NAD(P)-binding protein [Coniophora puteana RWD-64-598 SS2]|uniref:NAD(P)-binding protein n=1 Tax=Coniophora puteana (strain RWD-64-598) TaxID=741705 RepID=R7SEG9_CONPW|nr:NAD(P)-binding protein [Coniophora puteana RWD-64-598 SS2]EIW74573.1 NAD(P)-binding protein [Coniophora puteana RWD-64-598 SS2]
MKVLVIGASGFIGLPVAQALVRAGHTVYGLTRSAEKAKQLAADEIIPIVGQVTETAPLLALVPTLDVIIEAIGGTANLRAVSVDLLQAISDAAKTSRPAQGPKLSYIYTSGTWVHGHNTREYVSDTTPLTSPVELVAWRPAVEQRVLSDSVLNGIVIRPSLCYGRSGSLLATAFESAAQGKAMWYGYPNGRLATVHPDDLADVYVRAAERAQTLGGIAFDVGNDSTESVVDFLMKLTEVSGAQGYELREPSNAFEQALGATNLLRPYLAKSLLGWQPKKAGLVDGLGVYYAAWKASQDSQQPKERLFAKV